MVRRRLPATPTGGTMTRRKPSYITTRQACLLSLGLVVLAALLLPSLGSRRGASHMAKGPPRLRLHLEFSSTDEVADELHSASLDSSLTSGLQPGESVATAERAGVRGHADGSREGGLEVLADPNTRTAARTPAESSGGMVAALNNCWNFECLRWAHSQPRQGAGRFNFPHFLLVGWPKTATTSLFWHFSKSSQIIQPSDKEPEFFSKGCNSQPSRCPEPQQGYYLRHTLKLEEAVAANLTKATFEGSTHYAELSAQMARGLASELPWLRIVASLREPISRHISMLAHNYKHGRVDKACKSDVYPCLMWEQYRGGYNYSHPMSHLLAAFPADQLFFIQYERLVSPDTQAGVLRQVDGFLGLDSSPPPSDDAASASATAALERRNSRKGQFNPHGWAMTRTQYQDLVDRVRPDAEEVARLLESHGLIDSVATWLAPWETAWQRNLDACDKEGRCLIQLT